MSRELKKTLTNNKITKIIELIMNLIFKVPPSLKKI